MADPTTGRELNRLYWETDASVSEIADGLDISRRALYEGIEPQPAGRPCPECGAPLGFRNRTALERREAECPECGTTADLDGGTAAPEPSGGGAAGDADVASDGEAGPGPVLGGAFFAGLALGALTAYLLRRR